MSDRAIATLDMGSSKAASLIADLDASGKTRVLGCGLADCKGVRRGALVNVEEAARSAQQALREAEEQAGERVETVLASIGGSDIQGQTARGFVPIYPKTRAITRDDVLQVLNHSRQAAIPEDREPILAVPTEFIVDGQGGVSSPVGMSGGRLEVCTYLVTADFPRVRDVHRAVESGSRTVGQLVPIGLASGLGVLTNEQLSKGSVLVDIGAETTNVAVFKHGSIAFSAFMPVGGRNVSSDLATLLKTSPDEAEALKLQHGAALASVAEPQESLGILQLGHIERRPLQRTVFCEIIESRMREIAALSRKKVEDGGYSLGSLRGGVVVTGGGSQLPGTSELFASIFEPLKSTVASPHVRGPHSTQAHRPEFAVATGLARFALECCRDELSPAGESESLKDRMRTFFSLLGGRA